MENDEGKEYAARAERLFTERLGLMSSWQELAEQFCIEQACYTRELYSTSLADNLTTSAPLIANAELADAIGTLLRPANKRWFSIVDDEMSDESKKIIDKELNVLYKLMYNPKSGFAPATSMVDRSLAHMGNGVISCEKSSDRRRLLFKGWHVKDVAWEDNYDGSIGAVHRRWDALPREIIDRFPETAGEEIREAAKTEGKRDKKIRIYHCFMETERYMGSTKAKQKKYTSMFYDSVNQKVLESIQTNVRFYSIARWARVYGSQYAYSPATMRSLPDARLIQDMNLTLLEGGQKAIDPTVVEKGGAIRGDINNYAGGLITLDPDYDEKGMGDAIRLLETNGRNIPFGLEMHRNTFDAINESHYRGVIGLPPTNGGMSDFETAQRISDSLTKAAPIYSPLDADYSSDLCELAWEVAVSSDLIFKGDVKVPDDIKGESVDFQFTNPLIETKERAFSNDLAQAVGIIGQMGQFDPRIPHLLDTYNASKRAIKGVVGIGAMRSDEEVDKIVKENAQDREAAQTLDNVQAISSVVKDGSEAATAAAEAGNALGGVFG